MDFKKHIINYQADVLVILMIGGVKVVHPISYHML